MKYSKYSSYKDSGVEWLGEVPEHWRLWKMTHAFKTIGSGTTPSSNDDTYYNGSIPWVTTGELRENIITSTKKMLTKKALLHNSSLTLFPKNSILIAMYGATIGRLGKLGIDATTNQACCVMTNSKVIINDYLYYWLMGYKNEIINLAYGGGQPNISQDTISNLKISAPNLQEQQAIANYLDKATDKIDTLISKQIKLIELLKEKRQALISHAVTKGLNPHAKMKQSGVEWLGEIPEHWEAKPAQYIAKITRGAILRPVDAPEYFDDNGEWAYLNISDATKCDKYLTTSKLRLSELGSTKSARVYPDNVIITASATIGKAFINKIKVCIHDGFIPFTDIKIYKDYLYHYLSNPFLYAAMGKSNTQKNIYLDEVKRMVVTVPPIEEQIEIVDYLELKSLQMNNLIKKATKAIDLLKEKRTALISSAVTGKIDVREIA